MDLSGVKINSFDNICDAYQFVSNLYKFIMISVVRKRITVRSIKNRERKLSTHFLDVKFPKREKYGCVKLFVGILPSRKIYYKETDYYGLLNFVIFRSDGFMFCALVVGVGYLDEGMKLFIPRNQMEEILLEHINKNEKIKMSVTTQV
jgi:hypothetical protein